MKHVGTRPCLKVKSQQDGCETFVGSKVGLLDYGKYHTHDYFDQYWDHKYLTQLHFDSWNRNASILLNVAVNTDSECLTETPCFIFFISVAFSEA